MNIKVYTIGLLLVMMASVASAGNQYNVSIEIGNYNPTLIVSPIDAQNPTQNGATSVDAIFITSDQNGKSDINTSSGDCYFTKSGEVQRNKTSCSSSDVEFNQLGTTESKGTGCGNNDCREFYDVAAYNSVIYLLRSYPGWSYYNGAWNHASFGSGSSNPPDCEHCMEGGFINETTIAVMSRSSSGNNALLEITPIFQWIGGSTIPNPRGIYLKNLTYGWYASSTGGLYLFNASGPEVAVSPYPALDVAGYGSKIFAVGDNGYIQQWISDSEWQNHTNSGLVAQNLLAVKIYSESFGVATGTNGVILIYDGTNWAQHPYSQTDSITFKHIAIRSATDFYLSTGRDADSNRILHCGATTCSIMANPTDGYDGIKFMACATDPVSNNVYCGLQQESGSGANMSAWLIAENPENITFTCPTSLQYYDAPGTWTATCSIKDSVNGGGSNTTDFTYNSLTAMDISPKTIEFGSVAAGSTIGASNDPLVTYNQGNTNLTSVQITGYNLTGQTAPSYVLQPSSFRANDVDNTSGEALSEGSAITIGNVMMDRGYLSSDNVYIWVTTPNTLYKQTYSTSTPWVVAVFT